MLKPILLLSILTSFLFANILLSNNTITTYTYDDYDDRGNKTLTDITLDSGEVITATSNHPFWAVADHNWTEAGELTLDNILLNINE
jgi:hypothetical protein